MFTSFVKIAWRNLTRHKAFSFINITGLALGITCSLLIMLWVQDEKNVDAFHANGSRIYQVYERNFYDGKVDAGYNTQGLLAEELKRVVPGIQYASGLESASPPGTGNTFDAGKEIGKAAGFFAGPDFFTMFSYHLLAGNKATALTEPASVAISKTMAEHYFGDAQQAIGNTIRFDNKEDLKVTAVFEDVPANSSVRFEFLRAWTDFVKQNEWVNNWGNTDPVTYVQLRKDAGAAAVETTIKDFIYRYTEKNSNWRVELALQPYTEKYLHATFQNGYIAGGRIAYVNVFTYVAIFILLIACINFMNLATARSVRRAKEVGLRKVVGANKSTLVLQFTGEALLLTAFAMLLALVSAALLLPAFNALTGKALALPVSEPLFWAAILVMLVVTGVVAGSYPALFLSSLKPVKVLKGSLKFSNGAVLFRKGLVVFQFTLSIMLIVGMMVIYRQMNYIQSKNIGYDRENLVYIPIEGDLIKNYSVFKQQVLQLPGVADVSKMRNSPTVIEHHTGSIDWQGKEPNVTISFADAVVGYNFTKTMKLQMAAGRDFSPVFGADSTSYILNETAVEKMGLQNPVGHKVSWGGRAGTVIGVLKDFHFSSMHQTIEPLIVRLDDNWPWGTILVRTKAGNIKETMAGLEKICKEVNPKFPFTYQFSDIAFAGLYNSEIMVSKLSDYFAILAVIISCLGLFGLATFTAAQRTREIGIRKVIGASVANIIALLSGSFLKLIVVAICIAFPLSWYVMNNWLQGFAYKISLDWQIFAGAAFATIAVALVTVSYQSIKAAVGNPVKSLKTE
ncbi:ABC transporter permease [Panacibacter sp. DH6]|uniref:ABC transporter permease n=1 Tax=Panacibacter microcysteis TaxID=2793269 RepID=A0A931E2T7_9BACT|nr:ABC transporter permease [Panacibacter microcysteis]MBG9377557.1 ABC transporter permease [Panacibacter microcysteis]